MSLQRVAIIGAGGFAREVLDVFDAINAVEPRYDVEGFLVEAGYEGPGSRINDKPVLGDLECLRGREREVQVICGIGAPEVRARLVARAAELGLEFCTAVHPLASLTRWIEIDAGAVICAGCILTNQIRVGAHVHLNLDCSVGHDAVFEPFATLAPGVHVSGGVVCEQGSYVGTGANIVPDMRIGAWSIVGAGAVITQDVPPNSTVVGVPGRVVSTRAAGWHQRGDKD